MINFLQRYVCINTAYPNPDYQSVIALFKKHALDDGFLVNELLLPSGNPMLIVTMLGSSFELPSLALNHHMDVVPADNLDEWRFPPFSGTVSEGLIYGRGTQDCKGLGVAQYAALKMLKQKQLNTQRTIHLIMVPDEERGGFHGTKEFVEHPIFSSLNIGYVLDEGMPSASNRELLIKVDERTPIQIRVTSSGLQAHACELFAQNCVHVLTDFLAKIVTFNLAQQRLVGLHQPGELICMHITSLSANNGALNVIPSQAQATIDIRIPSRLSLDEGIALIDSLLQDYTTITYEILATSKERFKPIKSESIFYKTLAQAVLDYNLTPKPFVFQATTDARFYTHRGIQVIGFTPFSVVPNLHGTDEHISIKDLDQGTTILYTFLHSFCM